MGLVGLSFRGDFPCATSPGSEAVIGHYDDLKLKLQSGREHTHAEIPKWLECSQHWVGGSEGVLHRY